MPTATNLPLFDFTYLYNFTQRLPANSSYLVFPFPDKTVRALSYDGCVAAVGTAANYYTRQDVYDRLLLWRVPLIALWLTTTLPAFGLRTKIFTLGHLIADPIDTTWSLIYKLDLARRTTRWARQNDGTLSSFVFRDEAPAAVQPTNDDRSVHRVGMVDTQLQNTRSLVRQSYHDVMALIITAYDEWGYGNQAAKALNYGFNEVRWSLTSRTVWREKCSKVAFFIASDRMSRVLPSVASGIAFIVQIFAGFWKTLSGLGDTYNKSNPTSSGINRTPHNIAFGVLFFWLPFLVLLTALVGGSQTSHLIPRILEDFRRDFVQHPPQPRAKGQRSSLSSQQNVPLKLEAYESDTLPDISSELDERWKYGGLPVWQPNKFEDFKVPDGGAVDTRTFAKSILAVSVLTVALPTGCAMAVSWLTPTIGFGCRAVTQFSFLIIWVLSAMIDYLLFLCANILSSKFTSQRGGTSGRPERNTSRYTVIYWLTFIKDTGFLVATATILTYTALGIFNRCDCWCKYPRSSGYLSFVQEDYVFHTITRRLRRTFPILVGVALASQMLIFGLVWWVFRDGHRVLKQRDIDSILEDDRRHRTEASGWRRSSIGGVANRVWSRLRRLQPAYEAVDRERPGPQPATP